MLALFGFHKQSWVMLGASQHAASCRSQQIEASPLDGKELRR